MTTNRPLMRLAIPLLLIRPHASSPRLLIAGILLHITQRGVNRNNSPAPFSRSPTVLPR